MDNAPFGWISSRTFSGLSAWTFFFFLIYVNDLSGNLTLNSKLFADDTSLFSTLTYPNAPASQINNDFHDINTWAYQWKMSFKPDTSKQALAVKFSRKIMVIAHPQLVHNNNPVHETSTQRHLVMFQAKTIYAR